MSALETFANQIETYGVPYHEYTTQESKFLIKIFTMDVDTLGIIVYNRGGVVKEAKFIRNNQI